MYEAESARPNRLWSRTTGVPSFVWLSSLAFAACDGAPLEAPAPVTPPDAGVKLAKPTVDQEKALKNVVHRAHLESDEEKIECRACHRIEGPELTTVTHRCLVCHEDRKSAVHGKIADDEARECLTCHDFLGEKVNPWACGVCHVQKVANRDARKAFPNAPLIGIHGDEACNTCHSAHGAKSVEVKSCLECHEKSGSDHQKKHLRDPDQCLECHRGHESGEHVARPSDRCAFCHAESTRTGTLAAQAPVREPQSRIPSSALFTGHDVCLVCHKPHGLRSQEPCAQCHDGKRVVGEGKKEHQLCESCHPPHVLRSGRSNPCAECHKDVTSSHPPDEKLGQCVGCHRMHPIEGQLKEVRPCAECHQQAMTETSHHSGAACRSCHPAHGFKVANPGEPEFCLSCHARGSKAQLATKTVRPIAEHEKCVECHKKAAHAPSLPSESCGSCHDKQARSALTGHERCLDCHLPHEGSVKKKCLDCHAEQAEGIHREVRNECDKCHRPHGPAGPSEPLPCGQCHDKPLPLLHSVAEHTQCRDCHEFHAGVAAPSRGKCLGACHKDQVTHEPAAKTCIACHPFGKIGNEKK